MNRHTKLAIFIVPFLLIGGYIAADYYLEDQADQAKVFQLVPDGHCDVLNKKCILKSGDFKVNISDTQGITQINSTFPLDSATLFLVHKKNQVTAYQLAMSDSPYYWQSDTALRSLIPEQGANYKLRLIAKIKGGQYISEFYSQTIR